MSVEKLSDDSQSRREQAPFAQILNDVIEHIKDNDAFRLYSFLCSKDRSWKVIKEWTAKTCGVGERKSKQCWSYLARCGLIQYVEIRDDKGKILKHDIHVLVGYDFNKNEPFLNTKHIITSTGAETAPLEVIHRTHRCNNPPSGETTRVGFARLLNKDLTNKDFEQNKDKSFYGKSTKSDQEPEQKAPAKQHGLKEGNESRHLWAPMKNEQASIEKSEQLKRVPPPAQLKEVVQMLKRRCLISP